jgi:O-antigen/teichoic acid export membrane protein
VSESLKNKTVKGVAWTSLDQVTALTLGFIFEVILARLLSPSDYGLLAMIAVFNAVALTFVNSGFGSALVRKPDMTDNDTTTAFCFNIVVGIISAAILCLIAPYVAIFYDKPILASLLRVESLILIILSFSVVQFSQLSRRLDFKSKMIVNMTAQIIAGIVSITAAYRGFGVWSLVLKHIVNSLITVIMLWVMSPWRPRGRWDKKSLKYLWGYGSKLLASGVLNTVFGNIYPIVIGKFFSAAELGYYGRARGYAGLPSQGLTSVLQQVTFPVLSRIQGETERLSSSYRRMLRFSVFVLFPVMIGMAALAYPLVVTLVTDKWAPCVPYLQVVCFASMWYPVHAINLNLLQVKGRSDLFLKLEIIKKAVILLAVFICVPFGVMGICVGAIFTSLIALVINTYYTGKLINVGFLRQMRDMTPTLLASLFMGAVVYFVAMPFDNNIVKLVIGVPVGMALYLGIAWLFKMPELKEAIDIIKKR